MGYHLHWSWRDTLELELGERRVYVELLAARIAEENRQVEASGARI